MKSLFEAKVTYYFPQKSKNSLLHSFWARGETRKPWKSQKSRKKFSKIFKSQFSILIVGQNRKLGNKKTWNNFPRFPRSPTFSSFRFAIFSLFKKNFLNILKYRNSRSQIFFKKGVPKIFTIFTGKHLCWSLLETPIQVFSCKYCKIFKNSIFYRTSPVPASKSRQFRTLYYVKYCFQSLLKCSFLQQKYKMFKILPCCNKIYLL